MSQSQFKTNLLNMKRCPINHKQISIITHDIVKRVKNPKDYCKQSTTQRPPVTNMCALYIEIFNFFSWDFPLVKKLSYENTAKVRRTRICLRAESARNLVQLSILQRNALQYVHSFKRTFHPSSIQSVLIKKSILGCFVVSYSQSYDYVVY